MFALIDGTRVCELAATEFPVAPPLVWVEAAEGVTTRHAYVDGAFVAPSTSVDLNAYARDRRCALATAGTTWNGFSVPTDHDSRIAYTGAVLAAQMGLRADGDLWKFPHGFEPLSNAELIAVATAALAHVQACFDAESVVAAGIAAATIATPAEVDAAFAAALAP